MGKPGLEVLLGEGEIGFGRVLYMFPRRLKKHSHKPFCSTISREAAITVMGVIFDGSE